MTTVTTQAGLDAALADGAGEIIINSPAGVWLQLTDSGSSSVVAWDSSSVEAWDSSRVEARDSSRVVARDSSIVEAGAYTAVHLWSQQVRLSGGVVIDMTAVDLTDPAAWVAYHGVKVTDGGKAVLFKAVDADLHAGHGHTLARYPVGETVTAPDFPPADRCGGGLHFGVTPAHARRYFNGTGDPRFLAVEVAVETLVPLDDKAKAPSCTVVGEVDLSGRAISAARPEGGAA